MNFSHRQRVFLIIAGLSLACTIGGWLYTRNFRVGIVIWLAISGIVATTNFAVQAARQIFREKLARKSFLICVVTLATLVLAIRFFAHTLTLEGKLAVDPTEARSLIEELKTNLATNAMWPGRHVLATNSSNYFNLTNAANWISNQFRKMALEVEFRAIDCGATVFTNCTPSNNFGITHNIIGTFPSALTNRPIIILGAHYDTMPSNAFSWEGTKGQFVGTNAGTPGINDNGSGVAALLALARFAGSRHSNWTHEVRFVAFANEEPPFFQNKNLMGSWLYASQCIAKGESNRIVAMISLENLANYTAQDPNSKRPWLRDWMASLIGLPRRTDYVAFMSGWTGNSPAVSKEWAKAFATNSSVDTRAMSLPYMEQFGTEYFAWSDDWSFNQNGLPAFAICDTAFYRSSRYHENWDTLEQLSAHDLDMFTRVVFALRMTLDHMASRPVFNPIP